MRDTKLILATKLALGLTVSLLPRPHKLVDTQLFIQGRLQLWPDWPTLKRPQQDQICRLLGLRPDSLTDRQVFLTRANEILRQGVEFELVDLPSPGPRAEAEDPDDNSVGSDWQRQFALVPGRPLKDRIEEWFEKLEACSGSRTRLGTVDPSADVVDLRGVRRVYEVPGEHLPEQLDRTLQLETRAELPSVPLDLDALAELAQQIDAGGLAGPSYEDVAVDTFARGLEREDGGPVRSLRAGATTLAVAPTGTGKSVFSRLAAIHYARQGHPVALVVPDVGGAWLESMRLETAIEAAGLSLTVAPLSSWRKTGPRLQQHLKLASAADPDGEWAIRNMGYVCNLSAYTKRPDPPPELDEEPCTALRLLNDPEHPRVECPFASSCGRFEMFGRAVSADIIVVNHHSLISGKVPVPVRVDGDVARNISTAELILRRCPIVFIDEIDSLQSTAIGALSRSLPLVSSKGKANLPLRLLMEVERQRGTQALGVDVRFERGRFALMRISHEAERLVELINRGELQWPKGGKILWREALDAPIAGALFGSSKQALARVRALYERQPLDHPLAEAVRRVMVGFAGPGLGDGREHREVRAELMVALSQWRPRRGDAQSARDRLASQLVIRGVLTHLDEALEHLIPQLPGLEAENVAEAGQVRERLLGYAPWSPSPLGALGRQLFGYSYTRLDDGTGMLELQTLGGDPHGTIAELGDVVARALSGHRRVVVGFSATCRFPGSPKFDVLTPLLGFVADQERSVSINSAPIGTRVSGASDREAAVRRAATQLFDTMLDGYLRRIASDPQLAGRARVLLVTNSYEDARAATQAIVGAARRSSRTIEVRRVVPPGSEADDELALARTRLEEFGRVPGPAILVSPLAVVARGHNILQPNTNQSAISAIFVLIRPVPPMHEPEGYLAHVSYHARYSTEPWLGEIDSTLRAERARAWARIRALKRSSPVFGRMDPNVRREVICDVLVELAQLAGRARRGGTSVELYFVDAAFDDELAPWTELIRDVFHWWQDQGCLPLMRSMHGAFVHALAEYADIPLE